jgi:hypothetical protein
MTRLIRRSLGDIMVNERPLAEADRSSRDQLLYLSSAPARAAGLLRPERSICGPVFYLTYFSVLSAAMLWRKDIREDSSHAFHHGLAYSLHPSGCTEIAQEFASTY